MTTTTTTDRDAMLDIVVAAMAEADRDGDNWCDYVEFALRSRGIATADEQPDGSDPWEIVYLADGRMIVLRDESATGAARYAVVDRG